jgi:hypothetical protein
VTGCRFGHAGLISDDEAEGTAFRGDHWSRHPHDLGSRVCPAFIHRNGHQTINGTSRHYAEPLGKPPLTRPHSFRDDNKEVFVVFDGPPLAKPLLKRAYQVVMMLTRLNFLERCLSAGRACVVTDSPGPVGCPLGGLDSSL